MWVGSACFRLFLGDVFWSSLRVYVVVVGVGIVIIRETDDCRDATFSVFVKMARRPESMDLQASISIKQRSWLNYLQSRARGKISKTVSPSQASVVDTWRTFDIKEGALLRAG